MIKTNKSYSFILIAFTSLINANFFSLKGQDTKVRLKKKVCSLIPESYRASNKVFVVYDFNNCNAYTDEILSKYISDKNTHINVLIEKEDSANIVDFFKYSNLYKTGRLRIETFPLLKTLNLNLSTPSVFKIKNCDIHIIDGKLLQIPPNNYALLDSLKNKSFVSNPSVYLSSSHLTAYNNSNYTFYYKIIGSHNYDSFNFASFVKSILDHYYSKYYDSLTLIKITATRNSLETEKISEFILHPHNVKISGNQIYTTGHLKIVIGKNDSFSLMNLPFFFKYDMHSKKYIIKEFEKIKLLSYHYPENINNIDSNHYGVHLRPFSRENLVISPTSSVVTFANFLLNDDNTIKLNIKSYNIDKREYERLTFNYLFSINFFQLNDSSLITSSSNKIYKSSILFKNHDTIPIQIRDESTYILSTSKINNFYYFVICNATKGQIEILRTDDLHNYNKEFFEYPSYGFNYGTIDSDQNIYFYTLRNKYIYVYKRKMYFK